MIAGGVGFILNMLNLVDFLLQFKIIHFLALIGGAVLLKFAYGFLNAEAKDPIVSHHLSRNFFYLGMMVLAISLVMRNYNIPYYNVLLYLDIPLQLVALGISFSPSANTATDLGEEILDQQ